MKEIWKAVSLKQYADYYEVSNTGKVRRIKTGKILNTRRGDGRFVRVSLSALSRSDTASLKSLVARAFLDDYFPHCNILHKDGDFMNCAASNLYVHQSPKKLSKIRGAKMRAEREAKRKLTVTQINKIATKEVYLLGDLINKFDNQLNCTVKDFNKLFKHCPIKMKKSLEVEILGLKRGNIRFVKVGDVFIEHNFKPIRDESFLPTKGNTYIVNIDGKKYECTNQHQVAALLKKSTGTIKDMITGKKELPENTTITVG